MAAEGDCNMLMTQLDQFSQLCSVTCLFSLCVLVARVSVLKIINICIYRNMNDLQSLPYTQIKRAAHPQLDDFLFQSLNVRGYLDYAV